VVALVNASVQPFTDAVLEVKLKDVPPGEGPARSFSTSAVPPGTSWFAFSSGGKPETPLLSIWFLDNGCAPGAGHPQER
jgi:hypothetical protein